MEKGRVKWFDAKKGFGFLITDSSDKDVFVHYSVIEGAGFKTLIEGEEVEFEQEDGPKGPSARVVQRLE